LIDYLGIIAIANAISDMRALSFLSLASNNMQAAGAKHIAQAISQVYCSNGTRFEETTLLWGSKCKHCGGAKADHGNRALLSLNISNNHLVCEKGTGRFTKKTYDCDGDTDDEAEEIMEPDCSGIIALANAIADMRAFSKLDVRDNRIPSTLKALLQAACDAKGVSLGL
jgi:hypothetical protein